ncbi:hypothetical protein [Actinoplanes subtropicus]|uniref:hypothetical protein n=1 Tax=Actinoplanes subtropicus TaxID=543632 RepID=UPI0004C30CA8|nr:hypothetical protein [Actinoplanes subtropicus]
MFRPSAKISGTVRVAALELAISSRQGCGRAASQLTTSQVATTGTSQQIWSRIQPGARRRGSRTVVTGDNSGRRRCAPGEGVLVRTLPESGPHWPRMPGRERLTDMTAAVDRRFVARRHVDYGRVRSAMCPAY